MGRLESGGDRERTGGGAYGEWGMIMRTGRTKSEGDRVRTGGGAFGEWG